MRAGAGGSAAGEEVGLRSSPRAAPRSAGGGLSPTAAFHVLHLLTQEPGQCFQHEFDSVLLNMHTYHGYSTAAPEQPLHVLSDDRQCY